jgi:DNA replication ATP-dependent helicase Dna2
MLHQHYRMHDEIADLIQPYYNGRLISALARQKEPLPATGNSLLDSRLVWINFPPSRFAWYDPLQVDCVLKLTRLLAENGLAQDPTSDLGIVAPFRAMIHALRKELPDSLASLTIDTVERFQGSERKNIIITLPLHGVEVLHNVEALSADGRVDRKMNVAVSRAQERLFLLGCPEICARSPHYKFLMDRIRASGRVFHYTEI